MSGKHMFQRFQRPPAHRTSACSMVAEHWADIHNPPRSHGEDQRKRAARQVRELVHIAKQGELPSHHP